MDKSLPIVVTGSASGLGAEIALALEENGYTVLHYDLNNGNDVRAPSQWLGEITCGGLINCAGINSNEWFHNVSKTDLCRLMEVNAFGPVFMTQALLPELTANGGFVINIVSNAASIPMTSSLAYNMSKAAALMATKQMAHELTNQLGITVFSISPNKLAGTAMSKQIEENVIKTRGWTPEYAAEYQRKALMHGQETEPKAVADYIVHLLDSGSWKFMSGTDIPFGK